MPDKRFSVSVSAELYNYRMSLKENCVWDEFMFDLHCKQRVMGVDLTPVGYPGLGYCEKYGYFHVIRNEIGVCSVEFVTFREDEMLMRFLASSAFGVGLRTELMSRSVLKRQWRYDIVNGRKVENASGSWRYDLPYDFRKHCFEKEISLLAKVFRISELGKVIEGRLSILNKGFRGVRRWSYDVDRMEFVDMGDSGKRA